MVSLWPVAAGWRLLGVLPGGEQHQADPQTGHQVTHNLCLEVSCSRMTQLASTLLGKTHIYIVALLVNVYTCIDIFQRKYILVT